MRIRHRLTSTRLMQGSFAAALITGCSSGEPSGPETTPPPQLQATFVDTAEVRQFIPFGLYLSYAQKNPTWEIRTRTANAVVHAAASGRVVATGPNGQGDSYIRIRASPGWIVEYDHVLGVQVATGDSVSPGDVLGSVGLWSPGSGRTELQINRETDAQNLQVAVCPATLSTPAVVDAYWAVVQSLPQDYLPDPMDGLCYEEEVIP